jgi:hypothetical protein
MIKLSFTEVTDGSVREMLTQWQEAVKVIKEVDTVVGDVVFETIDGTITNKGEVIKVIGVRRVYHDEYSDLEFLKEDHTIIRFTNVKDFSEPEEFPTMTYTFVEE